MTPAKFTTALNSVNSVARKVFDYVPIQEAWPVNRIISQMVTAGVPRVDVRTAEGCIERLKDAGLVKEPERGIFQRVVARERETISLPSSSTAELAAPTTIEPPVAARALALGDLSARLRERATELLALADEIDTEALHVEERIEAAEARVNKFNEFIDFLKKP